MDAIKTARKSIEKDPGSQASVALAQLLLALECERKINMTALCALQLDSFELAIEILKQWRIDRRVAGKCNVFNVRRPIELQPSVDGDDFGPERAQRTDLH